MPPALANTALTDPPPPRAPTPRQDTELVEYGQYVDQRILRTRRMVKIVDIARVLLALAIGWIVLICVAAVLEHWVIQGGLTESGRYAVFGAAMTASIGLLTVRLLPIFTRRVNPLYAADAIEQTTPSLKNTLVNLLQLRGDSDRSPKLLRDELEREAAERIASAAGETAIDRGGVIRLGYLMIGLLLALLAYAIVSPKNPFATAARVLAPWANIAAPTRVRILDLQPGNAEFAQGQFATIRARITGLRDDEQAWLITSTADRQQRERRVPLPSPAGDSQFVLPLPAADGLGLQQDLAYRIEAGDARSRPYRLRVVTAPTIVVRSVFYDYPEYTGYLDRQSPNTGDIRAIEGTKVRIQAVANLPIDSAQIDLGADGRTDLRMQIEGQTAIAEYTLALREDRRTPQHLSYALRLTTSDGRTNNNPATYRIEVLPDLPPEVEIVEPSEPNLNARLNETVTFRLRAGDPDFGLDAVQLEGERVAGKRFALDNRVLAKSLLRRSVDSRFEGLYRFRASDHGLSVGDVVQFQAVAMDGRQPQANVTKSRPQRIRIVGDDQRAGDDQREADRQQGGNDPQQPDRQPPNGDNANTEPNGGKANAEPNGDKANAEPNGDKANAEPNGANAEPNGANAEPNQHNNDQQADNPADAGDESPPSQGGNPLDDQRSPDGSQEDSQNGGEDGSSGSESQESPPSGPNDNESSEGGTDGGGLRGEETSGGENATPNQDGGGGNNAQPRSKNNDNPASNGQGGGGSDRQNQNANRQPKGANGENDANGSSNPGQPGAGQQSSKPVASDGENDGEAFDRIQEFLDQEKGQRQADRNNSGGQAKGQRSQDETNPTFDQFDSDGGNQDDSSNATDRQSAGESTDRNPTDSGQDGSGEAPTTEQHSRRQTDSLGAQQPQTKSGGEKGDAKTSPRDGTGSAGESNSADDGQGQAADRGAGDETTAAGDRKASDKPTGNSGDGQRGNGSQSVDSDQGETGRGDKSAGDKSAGDKGAGEKGAREQGSQDAGNQSPNNDQPGDGQKGDGQKGGEQKGGDQPGDDQSGSDPSKGESGQPQNGQPQNGQPQNQQGNPGGERANGQQPKPGDPPPGEAPEEGQGANQPGNRSNGNPSPNEPHDPSESGEQRRSHQKDGTSSISGGGRNTTSGRANNSPAVAGDDANLDYTRKQTDLIVEKLDERLRDKNVERELLDKLGWTEDELRQFVKRWQARKELARKNPQQRAELDADLRSLGLKPPTLGEKIDRQKDNVRVGAGYRSETPAAVRERMRAYNSGVSRGQN